jgi:hypothetical protein
MPMKGITSKQRKAKGRKFQQEIGERIASFIGLPFGKDCAVESRPMGQAGVDIRLDTEARKRFPFSVECKFRESWNVPEFVRQASSNVIPGTDWLLFMRRSRENAVVAMDLDTFFRIIGEKEKPEVTVRRKDD